MPNNFDLILMPGKTGQPLKIKVQKELLNIHTDKEITSL